MAMFVACLIGLVPVSSSLVHLLAAPGPLWLHLTRATGFAPQKVMVDIHVEPVEADRTIWLTVYESGLEATSTEIPLEGARSRRTYHWTWEAKWPGDYTVVAQVGHGATARAMAHERLLVP